MLGAGTWAGRGPRGGRSAAGHRELSTAGRLREGYLRQVVELGLEPLGSLRKTRNSGWWLLLQKIRAVEKHLGECGV